MAARADNRGRTCKACKSSLPQSLLIRYYGEGLNAVITFASCYLPDSSIPDYPYVMENLFRFSKHLKVLWIPSIIGTPELTVAKNYTLVCLNGATPRGWIPSFAWIKQCYQTIDGRLRNNLKTLIIVRPTWYIRAFDGCVSTFHPATSTEKQTLELTRSKQVLDFPPPCAAQLTLLGQCFNILFMD